MVSLESDFEEANLPAIVTAFDALSTLFSMVRLNNNTLATANHTAIFQLDSSEVVAGVYDLADLHSKNYFFRSRADGDLEEAKDGDTTFRDALLANGIQHITTDFLSVSSFVDYVVNIPGGTPSRCNPNTTTAASCSTSDIEFGISSGNEWMDASDDFWCCGLSPLFLAALIIAVVMGPVVHHIILMWQLRCCLCGLGGRESRTASADQSALPVRKMIYICLFLAQWANVLSILFMRASTDVFVFRHNVGGTTTPR